MDGNNVTMYYSPVILEPFNARHKRRNRRNGRVRKLAEFQRNGVIPIDGPTNITLARKPGTRDITVFENKAANEVLADADSQYKSGYPTLATSSMLARRNRITQLPEETEQPDMKFFAELVKPIQYRWKFQREKIKTLAPSKHGFHPRSKSPTFHRLLEATEKLQILEQHNGSEINDDRFDNVELETKSQTNVDTSERAVLRYTRSEPYSTRSSNIATEPATTGIVTHDLVPEVKSIQRDQEEVTFIEEEEEDESYQSPEPITPPPKITSKRDSLASKTRTIDFKKLESHTEIHLFLPQIQDQMSRDGTPDREIRLTNRVVLPVIKDTAHELKSHDNRYKRDKLKTDSKRKKKKINRIKSSNHDKEVPDILNDVPTLISMEKEKPNDFHPESMCVFDNCKYHMDSKKSTRLRQP